MLQYLTGGRYVHSPDRSWAGGRSCLLLGFLAFGLQLVPTYAVAASGAPECIGGICLAPPFVRDADLIAQHGPGYTQEGSSFRCFAVAKGGPYVRFGVLKEDPSLILEVFVSDIESCPSARAPTGSFRSLATREGLKIGDEKERVEALYGKPARIGPASKTTQLALMYGSAPIDSYGSEVMTYFGSAEGGFPRTEIFLRHGRVSGVLISHFP